MSADYRPAVVFVGKNLIPEPVTGDLQTKLKLLSAHLAPTLLALGPLGARRREGCTIVGFPSLRPALAGGFLFYLIAPVVAMVVAVSRSGATIVCQSPFEAFGVALLRPLIPKARRPLLVVEAHGDWRTASRLYGSRARRLLAPLADRSAAWTVRQADRVRVVARYLERMVRDAGFSGPVDSYVTFSDFASFLEDPPTDVPAQRRVAFAAAFELYKAVDVLIEAWQQVVRRFPDALLEMGGSGPLEASIRDRVRTSSLGENIRFLGNLDRPGVKHLLDRCRFLVLPSRSEGLPRLIMESMARGRAILTTPVGDIPFLVEEGVNGILVQPGDPDALAEALCRLLDDHPLCAAMGRAGHERVKERDPVADYEAGIERLARWALAQRGRFDASG